jgi:aspartokinase
VRVRSTFDPASPGTLISDREDGPGIRSVALRRGLSLARVAHASANGVFCVLGTDAAGLDALVDGDGIAAVVCVGVPTMDDLLAGLRSLHGAGVRPVWAGNTSAGLLFAVAEGSAGLALRALHAGLIGESEDTEPVSPSTREVA